MGYNLSTDLGTWVDLGLVLGDQSVMISPVWEDQLSRGIRRGKPLQKANWKIPMYVYIYMCDKIL